MGTAHAERSSNTAMRLVLCGFIVLASVGCSTSHHASSAATTTIATTTTTFGMCRGCNLPRYGTITGRYYFDGGPPPPEPPHPIIGTITVTNVATREVYRPREDSHGYFTLAVPTGTYEVVARSRDITGPMTKTVTVAAGKAVDADLGIHAS